MKSKTITRVLSSLCLCISVYIAGQTFDNETAAMSCFRTNNQDATADQIESIINLYSINKTAVQKTYLQWDTSFVPVGQKVFTGEKIERKIDFGNGLKFYSHKDGIPISVATQICAFIVLKFGYFVFTYQTLENKDEQVKQFMKDIIFRDIPFMVLSSFLRFCASYTVNPSKTSNYSIQEIDNFVFNKSNDKYKKFEDYNNRVSIFSTVHCGLLLRSLFYYNSNSYLGYAHFATEILHYFVNRPPDFS